MKKIKAKWPILKDMIIETPLFTESEMRSNRIKTDPKELYGKNSVQDSLTNLNSPSPAVRDCSICGTKNSFRCVHGYILYLDDGVTPLNFQVWLCYHCGIKVIVEGR